MPRLLLLFAIAMRMAAILPAFRAWSEENNFGTHRARVQEVCVHAHAKCMHAQAAMESE